MRYTGSVTNAFVQSMARNFEDALRLMEAALSDCPDRLLETDLWPNEAPTGPGPHGGLHGSAPWFLAYHALSCLDYDLAGEFEPWAPPQPFDENTWSFPNRVFTKTELLGYIDYCRDRVRRTLDALTDEAAGHSPSPIDTMPRCSECLSAASRCTSLNTPPRSASSSPPPASSRSSPLTERARAQRARFRNPLGQERREQWKRCRHQTLGVR